MLLVCPTCQRKLKVDDRLAGRQGKCPVCGGRVDIPFPAPAAAPGSPEPTSAPQLPPAPHQEPESTNSPPSEATPKVPAAQASAAPHADARERSRLSGRLVWRYWQSQRRDEVCARQAQLAQSNPEVLAAAGELALAMEAAALRKSGGIYLESRSGVAREADKRMDAASELLAQGLSDEAVPLLRRAVAAYRKVGAPCAWDLADGMWNLGYAMGCGDRRHVKALRYLDAAACILRQQGRVAEWVRCRVTGLSLCVASGRTGPSTNLLSRLEASCRQLGLKPELLGLRFLRFELAMARGRLREARTIADDIAASGAAAAVPAQDDLACVQQRSAPANALKELAGRVVGHMMPDAAAAFAALIQWDPRLGSRKQVTMALRALGWAPTVDAGFVAPRTLRARLQMELALRATGRRSAHGWALARLAMETDPEAARWLEARSMRWLPLGRRQALLRLAAALVAQEHGELKQTLGRALFQQAAYLAGRGLDRECDSCVEAALRLGLSHEWLLEQLRLTDGVPQQLLSALQARLPGHGSSKTGDA